MTTLTLNDILTQPARTRSGTAAIDGVGCVTIHELTGTEVDKLQKQAAAAADADSLESLAFWAVRIIKGSEPDDGEVAALQAKLSPAQITDIYLAGLKFNGKTPDAQEAIEKN